MSTEGATHASPRPSGRRYTDDGEADSAEAMNHISTRLSDSCWVSDDEGASSNGKGNSGGRRTGNRKGTFGMERRSPLHVRSLSFSVGTTPGKQYPTRMSISPAASIGQMTPKRVPVTPTRTPSRSAGRRKSQNGNNMGYDPMSVCKGKTPGTSGKENNRSRFPITQSPAGSTPIGAAGTAVRNSTSGGGGSGVDVGVRKFDLMPPPMPRTPGGSGSGGKSTTSSSSMSAMRTTPVVSPLRQHDPNKSLQHQQQQEQQQQGRPERSSPVATDGVGRKEERAGGGGGDGIQAGVQHKHKSGDKGISIQVPPPLSPSVTPSRGNGFNLGSSHARGKSSPTVVGSSSGRPKNSATRNAATSCRSATAAAARCAPTPPRRASRPVTSASPGRSFFGADYGGDDGGDGGEGKANTGIGGGDGSCKTGMSPKVTAAAAAACSMPPPTAPAGLHHDHDDGQQQQQQQRRPPPSPRSSSRRRTPLARRRPPSASSTRTTSKASAAASASSDRHRHHQSNCNTATATGPDAAVQANPNDAAAVGVGVGVGSASPPVVPGTVGAGAVSGWGLMEELLADRAREFAEQAAAEALVGMPWDAARGFTRALKIVPKVSATKGGRVELLLARAQVLSSLGKHEACAEDCQAALRLDPTVLRGVTLLGHAYLRLGMPDEAARFLKEALALAMLQPDVSLRMEAQRACSTGIEENSLVGSALESGARAAGHGQHDAALAAAGRALVIAPQCVAAQEMRAAALLGMHRPAECVSFCETACIRPRSDPEDDTAWPPAPGSAILNTPVLAALGMAPMVARHYVSALRGCGRESQAVPAAKALRCRDPSLLWSLEDTSRWSLVGWLMDEARAYADAGKHDEAVKNATKALESDVCAVLPNAEAFCLRGSSRLGQGQPLAALDDCYNALTLVSLEGRTDKPFATARAKALLVRGRAYLALSRLGEAVCDLQGSLKCDPSLDEARIHLDKAEQRQNEAELQRQQRERQEREQKEKQAAAAAAAAAATRAKAEAEAKARVERARRAAAERVRAAAAAAAAQERARAETASSSARRTPSRQQQQRPSSPSWKPHTPSSRSGAGDETMKTPARGTGMVRSPKITSDSYYRRLGLNKDASEAAIKKAYRKLALKYHPDKNKEESAAHSFRLVSEAYRILTSPDSKQQYDRTRRYSIETPPSNGGAHYAGGGGGRYSGGNRSGSSRSSATAGNRGGYGSGSARGGGPEAGGRTYTRGKSSYW